MPQLCETTVTQGGRKLIASGSVIAFDSEPIRIRLDYQDDYAILEFRFEKDDGNKETHLKINVPEKDTIMFTYVNTNYDDLATYKAYGPDKVGTVGNSNLWLANYIRPIFKEGSIQIFYSAWVGEITDG